MGRKSEARNLILEKFKDSTCDLAVFEDSKEAQYVVVDAMQTLKSCSNNVLQCYKDLVHALLNDCRYTSRYFKKVHTYMVCFDDYSRVPLAKSVEQASRSANADRGEGKNALDGFKIGELSDFIEDGFSSAIHDRHYWCPELIRYCAKHWATDCPPEFLKEGDRLIVDGHYLKYQDLPHVGVHPDAPMVITKQNGEYVVDFMDDLEHGLGEGDLSMLYLVDKIVEQNSTVLLYSVDSDLMWYLLRLLEVTDKYYQMFWRISPSLSWCASPNPYPRIREKNKQRWCHINTLKQLIQSHPEMRKLPLEHRITTLAVVCAASGNDYVDPIKGVPSHHFINGFFNNVEYIGCLCDQTMPKLWGLEGANYNRLIDTAVRQSTMRKQAQYIAPPRTPEPKKMPSLNDQIHRKHHVEFFMDMMNAIGDKWYDEPNLSLYSYGRPDDTKPPGRGNLIRLHGDDNDDHWMLNEQRAFPPIAKRGKRRRRDEEEDAASDVVPDLKKQRIDEEDDDGKDSA